MRILVYSDYSRINHSVRPEAEIFLQLAAMGHEVCVLSPAMDPCEPFTAAGIRTATTGQTGKISPSSIRLLREELKSRPYDVVFATSSRTIPTAAFACIGFGARLVVYRGTTAGLRWSDPTSFLTVLHPRVDGVVAVSDAVREAVRKKLYRNRDKVASIFKGHNIDWYTDEPADLSEFDIPADAVVAIAVARFQSPKKGLRCLLEACELLEDLDNLHLLIVGNGADEEPYTSLVETSRMAARIHVTGRREDALRLIAAADFLVQPSIAGEGLPRAVIEALAFGKPIITTTAGGAKEVIEDGRTGLVVPAADSPALAHAIRSLAGQPGKVRAMSEPCRDILLRQLSHTKTAAAYAHFFESLCADAPRKAVTRAGDSASRLEIAAGYGPHRAAILRLLDEFEAQGDTLHDGRNVVKKMRLDDTDVVVKSFRPPGAVQALAYGLIRKSKARRAFEHAQRLRALGLETPDPVAYIEGKRRGRLLASYFISEFFPHDFALNCALAPAGTGLSPADAEAVIVAFTEFTFRLHEAGVLHLDHNAGNTLVRRQALGWEFAIIDINRMRFGSLTLTQRLKNLVRLTDDIPAMRLMARTYARLTNEPEERCERLLLKLKQRHWRRLAIKRRVKGILGGRSP